MADKYTEEHVKELEMCLQELKMPALIDRSARPDARNAKFRGNFDVTIAILSRAAPRFACLREGGKQLRESVFLVLSDKWLERKGDDLFLHRGAWMESGTNQTYIDRYDPPRRVTYFANFFTRMATFGERPEGEALEEGVHTAVSLSCKMEPYINDKLFVRALLERGLVSFPRTLGLLWKSTRKYNVENSKRLSIIRLAAVKRDNIEKALKTFIDAGDSHLFVVKRGGPERVKVRDVRYFDVRSELKEMVDAICDVLPTLPEGNSMLVEEFLHTMPSQRMVTERMAPMVFHQDAQALFTLQEAFDAEGSDEIHLPANPAPPTEMGFVVRALSVCDTANNPTVSSIVAVVGNAKQPIDMHNALPMTLPQVLRQWGVEANEDQEKRIIETVNHETRRIHDLLLEAERDLAKDLKISVRDARSDVISVDFILALSGSLINPQAIRVHDHDTLELFHRLETITKKEGEAVRPWVNTMISRSQNMSLRGKTVCIVGGGGHASRAKFQMYKEMGLRIVLVDEWPTSAVRDLIWEYVIVPTLGDHSKDEENAKLAVEALKKVPGLEDPAAVISGVTCIYDPCVVVGSWIARMLGKHGNDPIDHEIAKDKYKLAKRLVDYGKGTGVVAPPKLFIAGAVVVNTEKEVEEALSGPKATMTLPVVLKNTHGMCGIGVKLVRTVEEAKREFSAMRKALIEEISKDSSGLSFESSMFLMEYLDGTEHDVDIVMHNGELLCACVTDNGPTRLPYFNESSAVMPSQRHKDEVAALVAGAHQCCRIAGLHSGVFNVEMKYTSSGPRLIEINARLGGFYLTDWCIRVNNVHLLRCVIQIACNIRPAIEAVFPKPRCVMAGLQLYPSQHGEALKRLVPIKEIGLSEEEMLKQNAFRRLQSQGVCSWICMAGILKEEPAEWEMAYGNVGCEGRTGQEAATKLISLVNTLELDAKAALPVEHFMVGLGCIPLRQAQPSIRGKSRK